MQPSTARAESVSLSVHSYPPRQTSQRRASSCQLVRCSASAKQCRSPQQQLLRTAALRGHSHLRERSHLNRTRRGHRCDPGDVPRNDLLRRHGLTAVRHCGIASRRSLHRVCVVHRSRCGRLGGSGSECGDGNGGNGGRGDGNGRCHTLLKATLEIDPMRNYFHSGTKGAPK